MPEDIALDLFLIDPSAVPSLVGYHLDVDEETAGSFAQAGFRVCARLRSSSFGGNWTWNRTHVIGDRRLDEASIRSWLEALWRQGLLTEVVALRFNPAWEPTPHDIAAWVANTLEIRCSASWKSMLNPRGGISLSNEVVLQRAVRVREWVIQHQPAISLHLESTFQHQHTVADLLVYGGSPDAWIGTPVRSIDGTVSGTITDILGPLRDHRQRLLSHASQHTTREHIHRAPDTELVLTIQTRTQRNYSYLSSMLTPQLTTALLPKFGIHPAQAMRHMRLTPHERYTLTEQLLSLPACRQWVRERVSSAHVGSVVSAATLPLPQTVRVGQDRVYPVTASLIDGIRRYGVYQRGSIGASPDQPIRVGVLHSLTQSTPLVRTFLTELRDRMQMVGYAMESVDVHGSRSATVPLGDDLALEDAITAFAAAGAHVLLVLLPNEHEVDESYAEEDTSSWYLTIKRLSLANGLPSQVITVATLANAYALDTIVLGLLAKVGTIPYVLADPLPYTDMLVGIDVARRPLRRRSGSLNATAIVRMIENTGVPIDCVIVDAPLEGEILPATLMPRILPRDRCAGKRIVVHRDGPMRAEERRALHEWVQRIGATVHVVEVIKSGAPRCYRVLKNGVRTTITAPHKGDAFLLSDTEAIVVSSLPPQRTGTPRPLLIRCEPGFSIHEAVHSVLAMTLLHYGSMRTPRLPVTIHFSDKLAEWALHGIRPAMLPTHSLFWV